jgi:hypothetical protein
MISPEPALPRASWSTNEAVARVPDPDESGDRLAGVSLMSINGTPSVLLYNHVAIVDAFRVGPQHLHR